MEAHRSHVAFTGWTAVLGGALCLLLGSCSGSELRASAVNAMNDDPVTARENLDGFRQLVVTDYGTLPPRSSLALRPLTFEGGARASITTTSSVEADGRIRIDIAATAASGLRVLDLELDYDPAVWHSSGAVSSGLLASGAEATLLQFSGEASPGALQHTQALAPLDSAAGFSGDGVLATLWLAPGPVRQTSATALELPRPQELSYDPQAKRLEWFYNLSGDYDQNGEVNSSDIVGLARHFGKSSPQDSSGKPVGFFFESPESLTDGDGNGAIGLSDLTIIGRYLGARIDSYELYGSPDFAGFGAERAGANPSESFLNGSNTDPYMFYQVRMMASPAASVNASLLRATLPLDFSSFSDQQRRNARLRFTLNHDKAGDAYLWLRSVSASARSAASNPAQRPAEASPYLYPEDYGFTYDDTSGRFTWNPVFWGDNDQNGSVSPNDLTAVASRIGSQGPFDLGSIEYAIDSNLDLVIDTRDLRAIGRSWSQSRTSEYALFRVDSAPDVPANPELGEPGTPVWTGAFSPGSASAGLRAVMSIDEPAPQPGFYYVRPWFGATSFGPRSNVFEVQ